MEVSSFLRISQWANKKYSKRERSIDAMTIPNLQPNASPKGMPVTKRWSNWLGQPIAIKILITVVSLVFLTIHLGAKPLDTIALGILALGLLPWLPAFLDVAELPGGVKFQFAKVKEEQKRQARELEWIKQLVELVISEPERTHLRRLDASEPFRTHVKLGSNLEWELRHLLTLQLVDRHSGKGIRTLFIHEGEQDVKEHLFITKRGQDYLRLFYEVS
jgi:hypothetical protein